MRVSDGLQIIVMRLNEKVPVGYRVESMRLTEQERDIVQSLSAGNRYAGDLNSFREFSSANEALQGLLGLNDKDPQDPYSGRFLDYFKLQHESMVEKDRLGLGYG